MDRIKAAVDANQVVTRDDLLENFKSEIVMRSDNMGYFNPRVTGMVDSLSPTEVTHLKFIPMQQDGLVVAMPATADEPGATEFTRSETRRTGTTYLRLALNGFKVAAEEGRKLTFPVEVQEIASEGGTRPVLVFYVKRPTSKKSRVVPRKKKADAKKTEQPKAEQQKPAPAEAKAEAPAKA